MRRLARPRVEPSFDEPPCVLRRLAPFPSLGLADLSRWRGTPETLVRPRRGRRPSAIRRRDRRRRRSRPRPVPDLRGRGAELMPKLGGALREWAARPDNRRRRADGVLRTLHTLKGSARLAGAMRLGEMAHRLESAIEHLGTDEDVAGPATSRPLQSLRHDEQALRGAAQPRCAGLRRRVAAWRRRMRSSKPRPCRRLRRPPATRRQPPATRCDRPHCPSSRAATADASRDREARGSLARARLRRRAEHVAAERPQEAANAPSALADIDWSRFCAAVRPRR